MSNPGNIATYTNRDAAPRGDEAGSSAFETEGRHVEASYAQAGNAIGRGIGTIGHEVENYEEIQDSNAISVAGAKAFTDLSMSLRGTMGAADPNKADQTAEDWRNGAMEQSISNIGADANTQHGRDMAERVQNTLREEFTRQSMGASSVLAGQAAVSTVNQTANGLAQAVSNDPSLLPTGLAYLHGTIEDQLKAHSSLAPDEVARVRSIADEASKHIGQAAFQTMAERNPDAAKEWLKSGDAAGLFNGEEIGSLNRYADAQGRAKIEADKAAGVQLKQQQKQQFDEAGSSIYASMLKPDGTLRVPAAAPQQIIKMSMMPGAEPGTIRAMVDMVKTVNTENARGTKAVSDPDVYDSFNKEMLQGSLTDRDVYAARAQGSLSDKDLNYFRTGIHTLDADPARKDAEKQFQAFLTSQKSAFIHHSAFDINGVDPRQSQNFFQFSQSARTQFDQAYKNGTWQQSLQANNPQYLGRGAAAFMSNKKGAGPATGTNLTGTVVSGYRFTGTDASQWKDQSKWTKVGP